MVSWVSSVTLDKWWGNTLKTGHDHLSSDLFQSSFLVFFHSTLLPMDLIHEFFNRKFLSLVHQSVKIHRFMRLVFLTLIKEFVIKY